MLLLDCIQNPFNTTLDNTPDDGMTEVVKILKITCSQHHYRYRFGVMKFER